MIAVENHTVKYFRAPKDHFWHWTENGTVIQWANGRTICYRDDLFALLRQVNSGLPALSPLLLLLKVCSRSLDPQDKFFLRRELDAFTRDPDSPLMKTYGYALKFLEIVAALPENLRTGQKRVHLIYEVFDGASFTFEDGRLRDAIDELNSGRMDNNVFHIHSEKMSEGDFINCLLYFCTALQKYPTLQSLTVKLRTGLDEIPTAVPDLLPETETGSLYDQLLQDPQTAGIARLSKRLEAALNIPMQSKGSSDQPFGGISDITNRGNYDKLLLSELAHDDELLMARLVNNEALYFRREEPPQNPKMQRIILMDTTLKMWGTARVFALAAGLACARQNKHVELMCAFTLGGNSNTAVSLNSKHGIIQALEMLDPALHCGITLEALAASVASSAQHELIFITHARLLHHPTFYAHFTRIKQLLSFIVTVTDTGELQLFECINGVSKLISHAKIDIDELLAAPKKPKIKTDDVGMPAFLKQMTAPLFFPVMRVKIEPGKVFIKENFGAIAINETQRIFFWNEVQKSAAELTSFIEKGDCTFGVGSNGDIHILVNNQQRKLLKHYRFDSDSLKSWSKDLPFEIEFAQSAIFTNDKFYIENDYAVYVYECNSCIVTEKKAKGTYNNLMNDPAFSPTAMFRNRNFHKYFTGNEIVFFKIKDLYINLAGKLVVGKHELLLRDKRHIIFKENTDRKEKTKVAKPAEGRLQLLANKNLDFAVWTWNDGSQAIVDPRGLLHLKSSDATLPEITIILVLGRTIACWASDNAAAGLEYYVNDKIATAVPTESFYDVYIQKFIDSLNN